MKNLVRTCKPTMDSPLCYVVFLALLVLDSVSGVRFRYTSYYYSGYRYYYRGYSYTYYYYAGSSYGGGIAGIVVGCLITVGGIIACIVSFCILCRRRRRTAGRLITPAVYSPNTTSATGTVVIQGNTPILWAEGSPHGLQGQESGHLPPSYDMVVAGTTATSTTTAGSVGGISSPTDTDTAQKF
ncbi:uncharacterized protein LOC110451887 [Mizuhopecten yessoensis]|uniref:Uncharacterized protein n=1 Tax=Mizuhopecten yessoensis TaxID=6573 RepID=A0A210QL01_MIZYE|nr:uncharacterized protein LOC110451887 [Mizuhopecten yessoensis]OWF49386.1 hypothetical protein KP79_PYT11811 [Mizuhopecten yessoensis]